MQLLKCVALASLALGFATASQAAFIAVDSSGAAIETSSIATNNDFRTALSGMGVTSYFTGASLATDGAGSVTFYYYGKEAAYRNVFDVAGLAPYSTSTSYQNHFASPLEIGTISVAGGLLDFQFCAYNPAALGCLSNAQNDAYGFDSYQSIAMHIWDNTAWLFWDDSGAGPDDDHDDMLIKAVFTPAAVPEPATGALIGLGLLGLGLGRRRKSLRETR